MPETVRLIRNDVYLGELADLGLLWGDVNDRWVLVEPILLGSLSVWVVDVLLESNTEWQRDNLISTFWESDLL